MKAIQNVSTIYIVAAACLIIGLLLGPVVTGLVTAKGKDHGPYIIKESSKDSDGPSTKNFNFCVANSERMHQFCCTGWADYKIQLCEQTNGAQCEVIDNTNFAEKCTTLFPPERANTAVKLE